jgi:predicted alpha-1,6-mannanase (GH76 family)
MSRNKYVRTGFALLLVCGVAAGAVLAGAVLAGAGQAVAAPRAGDRAGDRTADQVICDKYCDGRNPSLAHGDRQPVSAVIYGRKIVLHFDDPDDMAWASIGNGSPGDEVWLDRSWDGGYNWGTGSKLGDTTIPSGRTGWRTLMYNVDNWSQNALPGVGVVRACGKAGNRPAISCTPWARTTWNAVGSRRAAATALMEFYNENTGLFTGTGWWNSANDLTAIIDNIRVTGMGSYKYVIANTWSREINQYLGEFRNSYMDDTGWWGLAWVDAYDLTGNVTYLHTAEDDANYMAGYWDRTCGGGIWWSSAKTYKNAIANELYLYLNADLHNVIHGDTTYLARAKAEETWFNHSGMINGSDLINDGLTIKSNGTCVNNNGPVWTYNQGVILAGLTALYQATGTTATLNEAVRLADASSRSGKLNPVSATAPDGELADPSSGGGDEPTFKGVYVRGLGTLNSAVAGRPYSCYLSRQAATAYAHDRNAADQYGNLWAGPWSSTPQNGPDAPAAAQQGSAVFLQDAGPGFASPSSATVTSALKCLQHEAHVHTSVSASLFGDIAAALHGSGSAALQLLRPRFVTGEKTLRNPLSPQPAHYATGRIAETSPWQGSLLGGFTDFRILSRHGEAYPSRHWA